MLHRKASKTRAARCEGVSTEGKCSSEYCSGSPGRVLRRFVTRRSNFLALDMSLNFFATVIAVTKAGTSEVVATDQTREMQMVRAQSPVQARTNKVCPPWIWQYPRHKAW